MVEGRQGEHGYGRLDAVDILPPFFVAVAVGLGVRGMLVEESNEVSRVLGSVRDADRRVVIKVPSSFHHPEYGSFRDWWKSDSEREDR